MPVTRKDLSFNKPFFFSFLDTLIFNNFSSSFKTFRFIETEKKFLTEFTCVSPIPSIFSKSLNLFVLDRFLKFWNVLKYFDNNFAFSSPICLIPKEYISLSKEIFFFSLIEYFKFSTESFPHPSRLSIIL